MSFTAAFDQFNVTLLNKNSSIHFEGFLIFVRYELRQYPKILFKNKSNFIFLKEFLALKCSTLGKQDTHYLLVLLRYSRIRIVALVCSI